MKQELIDRAIVELTKKGCQIVENTIFIPFDHGCGNQSFGRIDHLRKERFAVIMVNIPEQQLRSIVRKLSNPTAQKVKEAIA